MNALTRHSFLLTIIMAFAAASGRAQDFSGLSEEGRKAVNALMAERAQTEISALKLERELEGAWGNANYSSPEIDKMRKEYQDLRRQLVSKEQELRQKVVELPALRAKQLKLEELKTRVKELTGKIEGTASLPK